MQSHDRSKPMRSLHTISKRHSPTCYLCSYAKQTYDFLPASAMSETQKQKQYTGSCYCRAIKYTVSVDPEEARTSLCHCHNCKKFFGTNYGLTTKIPASAFKILEGEPKVHEADNGSGSLLRREFCGECGGGILEYGEQAKDKFRYIMYGTIDNPEGLDPKGEFFCRYREKWMPEIPGIFHKEEIKK